jgi:phytanoyl-CoA hydroxylase
VLRVNVRDLKADYDRDGFVIVREFLSPSAFDELRSELHRYITTVVPQLPDTHAFYDDKSRPETLKQMQLLEQDAYFAKVVEQPRWRDLAEQLLGDSPVLKGCEWFNKPAGTNHPTPPHQDNYYFNLMPPQVLTMWLALEDVDEENGCLRYIPGSHLSGRRPHARSNVLGFSQGIADYNDSDRSQEVPMVIHANDLLVHHGWTIHRADPNHSTNRNRPSFGIVYRGVSTVVDQAAFDQYLQSAKDQHRGLGLKV